MMHLYKVYYSGPCKEASSFRRNGVYRIATTSVLRAAELCEKAEPDATIYNVVHCGQVDHFDPDITKAGE